MKNIQVNGNLLENIEESRKDFNIIENFIPNYIIGVLILACYFIFAPITFEMVNILLIEALTSSSLFTYVQKKDFLKRKEEAQKALINFAIALKKENIYLNEDALSKPLILSRSISIIKGSKKVRVASINYIYLEGKLDTSYTLKEKVVKEGNKTIDYSIGLCEEADMENIPHHVKKLNIRRYRI